MRYLQKQLSFVRCSHIKEVKFYLAIITLLGGNELDKPGRSMQSVWNFICSRAHSKVLTISAFSMFLEAGVGFTEAYIKETGRVFDLGFDDMSTPDYNHKKAYMIQGAKEIGDFFFSEAHFDFIDQQEKVVHKMCGFKPQYDLDSLPAFTSALKYNSEMHVTFDGFMMHYKECLAELGNMVAKEEMTKFLYDEYKASWQNHITSWE